jgi:hypothetical protein
MRACRRAASPALAPCARGAVGGRGGRGGHVRVQRGELGGQRPLQQLVHDALGVPAARVQARAHEARPIARQHLAHLRPRPAPSLQTAKPPTSTTCTTSSCACCMRPDFNGPRLLKRTRACSAPRILWQCPGNQGTCTPTTNHTPNQPHLVFQPRQHAGRIRKHTPGLAFIAGTPQQPMTPQHKNAPWRCLPPGAARARPPQRPPPRRGRRRARPRHRRAGARPAVHTGSPAARAPARCGPAPGNPNPVTGARLTPRLQPSIAL